MILHSFFGHIRIAPPCGVSKRDRDRFHVPGNCDIIGSTELTAHYTGNTMAAALQAPSIERGARFRGALLGLAVCDALGARVSEDSYAHRRRDAS